MEYACASRMRMDDFRNLIVWQLADELRREILAFTDTGPASTDFKYRDQIPRCDCVGLSQYRRRIRSVSTGRVRALPRIRARALEGVVVDPSE
jgi:hypothetical protein